jgi:iron complex transport system permease protein
VTTLASTLRVGPTSWLVPVRAGLVTAVSIGVLAVLVVLDLAFGDFLPAFAPSALRRGRRGVV